jgi:hypothetical protein
MRAIVSLLLLAAITVLVLALAGCAAEPHAPVPLDSHGQPLLWTPDGYVEEPTPIPEWAIKWQRQERIKELRRQLAEAEREAQ